MYWMLYPTPLFSSIRCPSPFWGPAYEGIPFWASAAHGSGSWRVPVGTTIAWHHQTCFLACRAWMFQHALLGAVQQNPPLGRHPHGAPTLHAPGLTHWSAVGGQTGPKRQWKVPAKYINAVFTMYFICKPDVLSMYFEGIGCELTENFDVLVEY